MYMTKFRYCYHCGTRVNTTEEEMGELQNYCSNCGTRLRYYQKYETTNDWMDNLTSDEARIVDDIEKHMDAGYIVSHNQLFNEFKVPETNWKVEYFHSEFVKHFKRLKLCDRQQFQSYVRRLVTQKKPQGHKQVKLLPGNGNTYRLKVSYDVRAIFRLCTDTEQQRIRFILIGKQDHIYDMYKQKVNSNLHETDKYCSHCGHEIHYINDGTWIDMLDPDAEEGKLLDQVEQEIDRGHWFTHERAFGRVPSLTEQPLLWGLKYRARLSEHRNFTNFYIQDQKRFLAYVEELVLLENPLDHPEVKELTNRRKSYRLKISPFVRAIFSLERTEDTQYIRFLNIGKEDDDYRTVNGNFWCTLDCRDYCMKCGYLYQTEDCSWMDELCEGEVKYLKDSSEEVKNGYYLTYEEVFGQRVDEEPSSGDDQNLPSTTSNE